MRPFALAAVFSNFRSELIKNENELIGQGFKVYRFNTGQGFKVYRFNTPRESMHLS